MLVTDGFEEVPPTPPVDPRDGAIPPSPVKPRRVPGLCCLGCRSETFEVVNDGDLTLFRCTGCDCFWHVELGYISLMEMSRPAVRRGSTLSAGPVADMSTGSEFARDS